MLILFLLSCTCKLASFPGPRPASRRLQYDVILCVRTHLTIELNLKLTKSLPRRHSLWGVYMRKKYLCKKLGVKEGGGHLLQGGVFWGAYGITHVVCLGLSSAGLILTSCCLCFVQVLIEPVDKWRNLGGGNVIVSASHLTAKVTFKDFGGGGASLVLCPGLIQCLLPTL